LWLSNYIIAYDVECIPSSRFKHIVDLLDIYEIIDFISLKEADKSGLLDQVPQSIRFKSFHLLNPSGDIKSGPDALLI
jgi:predicted DCC family thiol-disulfide oxidoreductase YuxK